MAEPTYPIVELIAQAIAAKLATITAVNLWRITIPSVTRPKRLGIDKAPQHLGAILVQESTDLAEESSAMGNPPATALTTVFNIAIVIRLSEAVTTSFDEIANVAAGEVVKALAADVHWGGLAMDTRVGLPNAMQAEDGSFEGVAVEAAVTYRVAENDPFTQI